ncbi:unnamed protein product [Hymenolepis diminuta]|uniref:NFH protein n=1 Tax=Hymenolepis diminuta TaxID=6216 RepID=A0A0R3SGS3_HYMDI|nr:unnamed protein product [Hymenolepis diminuta]
MELEEYYLKRLEVLREQLKEAEQRAAEAERQVSKLQNEVDRLEGSIYSLLFSFLFIYYRARFAQLPPCLLHAESRAEIAEAISKRYEQEIQRVKG